MVRTVYLVKDKDYHNVQDTYFNERQAEERCKGNFNLYIASYWWSGNNPDLITLTPL